MWRKVIGMVSEVRRMEGEPGFFVVCELSYSYKKGAWKVIYLSKTTPAAGSKTYHIITIILYTGIFHFQNEKTTAPAFFLIWLDNIWKAYHIYILLVGYWRVGGDLFTKIYENVFTYSNHLHQKNLINPLITHLINIQRPYT